MERHPFIVTMRAYLDGIQSTVGQATLRERESKLLYLFEVMLELRLSPDPRTMDKEEIDALVLWMRERNLGLAYQAKLWQYVRGLLAFVGNNILEVMKARGQWRPPKRAYRPVTVKDDSWFSATVARLANETGWRPRMVLAATAIYYHTGLRPKELRLAALKDLDLQRWILTVLHPKGEGAWAVDGEQVRLFPEVRPFVLDYIGFRAARVRQLDIDPAGVDGFQLPRIVFIDEEYGINWWVTFWTNFVRANKIREITESPFAMPSRVRRTLATVGETSMGSLEFAVILRTGERVPCWYSGYSSFIQLPAPHRPADILDVEVGRGLVVREEAVLVEPDFVWCVYR